MKTLSTIARASAAAALAGGLLGCGVPALDREATALKPEQLATLDKHLGGKTAGDPVLCIPRRAADSTIRISDDIILYRVSNRLVYRNDLASSCNGLGSEMDILVVESYGPSLCKGDRLQLVDRSSGISMGSCSLGKFTPYRAPAAD